MIELYQDHADAMVRVRAIYRPTVEEDLTEMKIGTGFFISREGLVLSHAITVRESFRIWVEHRGVDYGADLLGFDARSNVALLRLNTLPPDFGFFQLGDQLEMPPIGTTVVRLSMPLEFAATPELGLITGREARVGGHLFPCFHLRTSIPSGPGDGGAAFLDLNGRLVAVQVASLTEMNATYGLPARAALRLRDDLLFSGEVTYGWLGFEIRPEATIASGPYLVLSEVMPESPAAEAGLRPGDVLRQINGALARDLDELRDAMFYTRVGQRATITISRDGERREFSVRLAERPVNEPLLIVEEPDALAPADPPLQEPNGTPVPPDPTTLGLPPDLEADPPMPDEPTPVR